MSDRRYRVAFDPTLFARRFAGGEAMSWRHAVLIGLLNVAACREASAPPPTPSIALTLCTGAEWIAYQNDGFTWTRLTPTAGRVTFAVTERLAIAQGQFTPATIAPHLRIDYVTAAQASAVYGCRERARQPPGAIVGTVRGLAGTDVAQVSYRSGPGAKWATPSDPTFALVPWAIPSDLIAARMVLPGFADRAIVRRSQQYADGTTLSLEFTSSESFALAQSSLQWNAPGAGVQINFQTQTGNDVVLQSMSLGASGAQQGTIYSMPSARLADGDVHRLLLSADQRSVLLYYREPRNQTLAFGPPASPPMLTTIATSPYRRLRASVAPQPDYDATVRLDLRQPSAPRRPSIGLSVTREYLGLGSAGWTLTVPDLSRVDGFDPSVGFGAGEVEWVLTVSSVPFDFPEVENRAERLFRRAWANGTLR